jgi:phosphoglycolate phosphatase
VIPGGGRKPRAVIFDWDNTLVDTWAVITECTNVALRSHGLPEWSEAQTRARAHGSLRDTFPKIFGSRWGQARETFYRRFNEVHLERLRPLDGAADLLDRAAATGALLAVVSNKVGQSLRKEADHLGWRTAFHKVIGAGDAARDKPAPDPVFVALEGAGFGPGPDVWFVGDTAADLQCAHASGCTAILVREDPPLPGEFADCQPALHVHNCRALAGLMR